MDFLLDKEPMRTELGKADKALTDISTDLYE